MRLGQDSVPSRAQAMAKMALHDFAASGVDEDLEQLRAAWKKPPDELLYEVEDDVWPAQRPANKGPTNATRAIRAWRGPEPAAWQGPLDPPSRRQDPARKKLESTGVAGGARASLGDYRSGDRLDTLQRLRRLSTGDMSPRALEGAASCALACVDSGGSRSRPVPHAAAGPLKATEVERAARVHAHAVGGGGGARSGLEDWAAWEARWAEQLKDFQAYENRTVAVAEAAACARERERAWAGDAARDSAQRAAWGARVRAAKAEYADRREASEARRRAAPSPPPPSTASSAATAGDGWRPRHAPPPSASPTAAAAVPSTRRFASWAEHDRAYQEFERKLPQLQAVRVADVPWPPEHDPCGAPAPGAGGGARKKALQRALLRWHPDKWGGVLAKVGPQEERAAMAQMLQRTTQLILKEKEKGY
eukprot:Transcript_3212.p2 GENE.Transcript_3212~~Transcript_3212.p2  ORF type:complete len:421 (-),score=105.91 Transcript_3212:1524-2786(-)